MVLQTPSQALRHGRSLIRELAARHRTANPRVFGSVVTGQDREGSDLDVLVEPLPETTLFDLGGLQDALEGHGADLAAAIARTLDKAGVPADRIHYEFFGPADEHLAT